MIYIFDILGAHCGMHYYDMAFVELLNSHGYQCVVLSNFEEKGMAQRFFPNFFKRGKLSGIIRFAYAYLKFPLFLLFHRSEKMIYLTYGEVYEIPFLLSLALTKKAYVDVHEVHALKYKDDSKVSRLFELIYQHVVKNVIYHSDRTRKILSNNFCRMLYVPHFKYVFKKTYNNCMLGDDVRECFMKDGVRKFLYFGNLSVVKGIDTVIDVFREIKKNQAFELVIAGKNVDGVDFSTIISDQVKVIDRHINDDELVYLFSHTDYVLLPYKKSSQSGVFAMSSYFHKPMIMSDIPYFRKMIEEFPSFGKLCSIEDYKGSVIDSIKTNKMRYFCKKDCEKFEMRRDNEKFLIEFNQ